MHLLYQIFIDPFVQMGSAPDLFVQTLWEGLVAGVLYALIALGFVLIFKASGVFNFAQGIMVVFAALTLVGLYAHGVPAFLALAITIGVMFLLALAIERFVLRPLVNQPDIILFMATFGLTYILIGAGELIFGGDPKVMIADQLAAAERFLHDQDAGRLRADAEDRHRRRHHRLADGGDRSRCSSRRRASGARCARSPTATAPRSRSASRSNTSG